MSLAVRARRACSRALRFTRATCAARLGRAAAAGAVLAASAGCTDLVGVDDVATGRYDLVAAYDRSLPYVVDGNGDAEVEVVGGTLELYRDQMFEVEVDLREVDFRTGASYRYTEYAEGRYSVRGRTITYRSSSDPDLDGETGRVDGRTVTVGPLTFER